MDALGQREVAEVAKLCLEVLDASAGATKQPLEPRVRTEGSATMRSGAKRSKRCLKLKAPSGRVSSSRCSQLAQTTCQELASTLHSNSGYHGPWVHRSLEDQFIWVKLPERELLTLEIKNSTYLHDVIAEASKISESITPTTDVYITCGRKVIDPRAPLCAQEVVEGSVLRIHYRSGQPECYSLFEGMRVWQSVPILS